MKTKNYVLLIIISVLLLSVYLIPYDFKKTEKDMENIKNQIIVSDTENIIKNVNFEPPDKSGPITYLPWENDPKFIKAQEYYWQPMLLF